LSPLAVTLLPILEQIQGTLFSELQQRVLEDIISDHGLNDDNPSEWMVELFEAIPNQKRNFPSWDVPSSYPHGENGLANLLADISRELCPLQIQDYGEGATWSIPEFDVVVTVMRETSSGRAQVSLRPI